MLIDADQLKVVVLGAVFLVFLSTRVNLAICSLAFIIFSMASSLTLFCSELVNALPKLILALSSCVLTSRCSLSVISFNVSFFIFFALFASVLHSEQPYSARGCKRLRSGRH